MAQKEEKQEYMSCKAAVKRWEQTSGEYASDATEVKMLGLLPQLQKLDKSLAAFESVEKLSLSTNAIEKMEFPQFSQLKVLSLGRNRIKRISGLENVSHSLEQLWISYNYIEKFDGLFCCTNLHTLFMSHNKVKSWGELGRLQELPALRNVQFTGNPIYQSEDREENASKVLDRVPQVEQIDGHPVTEAMRSAHEE